MHTGTIVSFAKTRISSKVQISKLDCDPLNFPCTIDSILTSIIFNLDSKLYNSGLPCLRIILVMVFSSVPSSAKSCLEYPTSLTSKLALSQFVLYFWIKYIQCSSTFFKKAVTYSSKYALRCAINSGSNPLIDRAFLIYK